MQLKFLYPHWGSAHLKADEFFDQVNVNNFNGIEINIPKDSIFETDFYNALQLQRQKQPDFIIVAQQVFGIRNESSEEYKDRVITRLKSLIHYRPDFINSHTGKDHYSFSENCQIIEAIENFSIQHNIPVYHEIHRGRFTFHSATTLKYLKEFPKLKLVGDLSHWCVVSESMLEDQKHIISEVIPHIFHLHARVGFEQAPQVNHPFAPEWDFYLQNYLNWWIQIVEYNKHKEFFTITPEFGPYPYMPQEPFTQRPLSAQNEINIKMRDYLKARL